MERRALLATVAAVAGGLAGCTGSGGADGRDPSPSPTPVPTQTRSSSPARTSPAPSTRTSATPGGPITGTTFEIEWNGCGTGTNEATVERNAGRVVVRGTISGRNSCFTAALERATYDTGASELTVAVRSFSEASTDEACGQCLAHIEYRATVSYDAPDPETVTVVHNDEVVDRVDGSSR